MIQLNQRASRPRVSYSPAGYKRATKQYEQGRPHALIRMMDEAAVDSHVDGCLVGRRAGFKKDWTLKPFEEDSAQAEDRVAFFRRALRRLRLYDLLEDIHDGHLFFYSVISFEWDVIDGRSVPVGHEAHDQHYFRYTDPDAPGFGELAIDRGNHTEEIPEEALVVEARKNPGMMPVVKDFILKNFGVESWASFLETFAEPFLLMTYPQGANEEAKQEIDEALESIAASSRGRAPQGTELEMHETGRSTGDHQQFKREAEAGIAVSLLGHKNAVRSEGGINVGGNDSPFEVRHSVAVDDMRFIEQSVNQLVRIIGDRNFGDGRYPRFELHKAKPVDAKQHRENVRLALGSGVGVHKSEFEKLGLQIDPDSDDYVTKPQSDLTRYPFE